MAHTAMHWLDLLHGGALDGALASLYGAAAVQTQRARYDALLRRFAEAFGGQRTAVIVSAPGRTELCGNHTDHQRGHVLAAAVAEDCVAVASPRADDQAVLLSEGYAPVCLSLGRLEPDPAEQGTPAALLRGVAAGLARRGHTVGGFDAVACSTVPAGAGMSSSAAFEVLLANCLAGLYGTGAPDPMEIARVAWEAENRYFGKPCGQMDQLSSSLGGIVHIDFADAAAPRAECVVASLSKLGLAACLMHTGGSHADLTREYAAIPADMRLVAARLGKEVLSEVEERAFYEALPRLRGAVPDLSLLRAMHFFQENARVPRLVEALRTGDAAQFLALVRASGRSSFEVLQNVCPADSRERGLALALALTERFFACDGMQETAAPHFAARVHGGGFAGAIQTFLPVGQAAAYTAYMEGIFGPGSCRPVVLRPAGGTVLAG